MDTIEELIERHNNAAIEASAGTGKTFRIKNIVLELVKRGVPIQKMLIVTFTEKAAGELRDRVRATLEEAVEGAGLGPSELALVKTALAEFDTAAISTIHSFCQSILKEYAFENQMPMTSEVMSGYRTFAEAAVREVMRTELVKELSLCGDEDAVRQLGALAGEKKDGTGQKGLDRVVSSLASLVAGYRGEKFDQIEDVDITDDFSWSNTEARIKEILASKALEESGKEEIASPSDKNRSCYGALATAFNCCREKCPNGDMAQYALDLGMKKNKPYQLFEYLTGITAPISSEFVEKNWKAIEDMAGKANIQRLRDNPPLKIGVAGFPFPEYTCIFDLLVAIQNENARIKEQNENIKNGNKALREKQTELKTEIAQGLKSFIFRKALELFRRKVADAGNITFDTMILSLKRAIDDPELGPSIVAALQRKYSVAIIDEFQDTDAVQWGIFEKVFKGPAWSVDDRTDSAERRRLIVVGDPKQSIYAFRSADLETYTKAHDLLSDSSEGYDDESKKRLLSLDHAFRSTEELVSSFSKIFGQEGWFGKGDISYPDVRYPGANATVSSKGDATGLPAISLVDCLGDEGTNGTNDALASLARQSVDLIVKTRGKCVGTIVRKRDKLTGIKEEKQVVLRNGDYCILVERRRDAKPFIRELRKKGIPYTFYKETGLTNDSPEIETVTCLLGFLLNPQDVASRNGLLISDFFARDIKEIADGAGLEDPELGEFLNKARKYVRKQEWEKLFDCLLNEPKLAEHCLMTSSGAKRFEAYRQIFDKLLSSQTHRSESLLDFMDILRNWRSSEDDDVDGDDYRRKDTADDRVQIMTMHASKGLEFPFVIIGSGFSDFIKSKYPVQPYTDKGWEGRRVCAVDWTEAHKTAYREKAIAECKRLYYVALTRAQFKIVAPFKANELKGNTTKSQPLNLFLTNAYEEAENEQLKLVTADVINSIHPQQEKGKPVNVPQVDIKDVAEKFDGLYINKLTVDSFSGLNKHKKGDGDSKDDETAPSQELTERKKSDPLEPGAKGGTVFHAIMEALCKNEGEPNFNTVGQIASEEAACQCAPLIALVEKTMAENRLRNRGESENATRDALAKMAWRVLTTPIELESSDGTHKIRLGDIPFADRRAEVEFHTREGGESGMLRSADIETGKTRLKYGFMTGFIDLLFKHDGRYYILDWKTNMLEDYSSKTVKRAMLEAGYKNQFKTYWLAFAKQLEDCGLDASATCGGSVYLFVRGVGPAGGAKDGQYTEACDLTAYAKEIAEFISPTKDVGKDSGDADKTEAED